MSGQARPNPPFQIAKCVKGWKHSMIEMRSESDLQPQSISQAIHARVKTVIANHGGVAVMKINGRDRIGEKSMATAYFVVHTSPRNIKIFSL